MASRKNGQHPCKDSIGSYTCQCRIGFYGDGSNCENVDECRVLYYNPSEGRISWTSIHPNHPPPNDCHSDATCEDTLGSYKCICDEGMGQVHGPFGHYVTHLCTVSREEPLERLLWKWPVLCG